MRVKDYLIHTTEATTKYLAYIKARDNARDALLVLAREYIHGTIPAVDISYFEDEMEALFNELQLSENEIGNRYIKQ
jgi:hypothetical protein